MQATATPRRPRARRVIYKSTALERTAPQLVAAAPAGAVSAARSIQRANEAAEQVRLAFKQEKDVDLGETVEGDDTSARAKKHSRRLKLNRHSAAASRVRREAYTKALEAELVNMEKECKAILVKLQAAREKNKQLAVMKEVVLVEDGTAQALKQENELQMEVEEMGTDTIPPCDFQSFEDDTVSLPSNVTQQFSHDRLPHKAEELLADSSFVHNSEILEKPVPDDLPDCFRSPPLEDYFWR